MCERMKLSVERCERLRGAKGLAERIREQGAGKMDEQSKLKRFRNANCSRT